MDNLLQIAVCDFLVEIPRGDDFPLLGDFQSAPDTARWLRQNGLARRAAATSDGSAAPVLQKSIRLRNPYVDPLSFLQVELLRRLRALPPDGDSEDLKVQRRDLRAAVLLSVNGIAAGMKNTG